MPPKKKKGGGGGGKKKAGKVGSRGAGGTAIIDGVATTEMTKEELEAHIHRLCEELDREREERNFFQLERDKINTFWEITKRQLEEKNADLRCKDREMEDAEEHHQVEIKVYKQKIKHLLFEHQNSVSELRAEEAIKLKLAEDEHRLNETELLNEKRDLKHSLKEQELSQADIMKTLKLKHDSSVTDLRKQVETQVHDIEVKYEKKMRDLRDELELRRRTEIHEIEERKNSQISTLMKNHEKAFGDIKNYYNDITLNNLALINTLKETVEDLKRREERMEKQVADTNLENKRLKEPLAQSQSQVQELTRQLGNYDKDKVSLASYKARLKTTTEEFKNLQWEHEVLEQRFSKLSEERNDLRQKFISAVNEVQQKCSLKNLVLEKKLATLTESLEKNEAQLNEVLAASNLDPQALSIVTKRLEDVLDAKNTTIRDLQYEVARVCKAHNDILKAYEAKLQGFGIPPSEVAFKPKVVPGQSIGKGPAGLVSTAP